MTLRVAICEDSLAYARGIARLLEEDDAFEVVTIASDAETLLRALPTARPDLVTMDLELGPGLHGAAAVRRIMATYPVPVVVLSAHAGRRPPIVVDALAAGAVEAISKSDVHLGASGADDAAALRRRLVAIARGERVPPAAAPDVAARAAKARAARSRTASGRAATGPRAGDPAFASPDLGDGVRASGGITPARRSGGPAGAQVVGIVSSTGGPQALRSVLSALPPKFGVPVVVVQHITDGFAEGLADWLADVVAVPVRMARDGEPLAPGVVIAPTGTHLVLQGDGRLAQDQRDAPGPHRPSGDVLLDSLARTAGSRALGVVLTGMGRDGARGVASIVGAGGDAWAQRPAESAVWGMPAAAVQAGADPRSLAGIGAGLAALNRRTSRV
ncbi:chemotaxis protein CheB [Patulibacter americanus]|uniref:chemotaxis protein CheB n=1 Tax=Patulibacter americanus TaxID=588672 RepID=UPI0003B3ECC1|nr:chemotaxis protein CheB [Patulibacter americanus]